MPAMLSVPTAPPAPPGPPDSASAPPGRETEGPPFKEVLKDHQARTAKAEGRSGGDDTPKGPDKDDPAATGQDAAQVDTCAAVPGAVQALAVAAAVTPAVPATTATPETAATTTATPADAVAQLAAAAQAPAGAVADAPAAAATGLPAEAATATTALPAEATAGTADAAPTDSPTGPAPGAGDRPAPAGPSLQAPSLQAPVTTAPAEQAAPAPALAGQPAAAATDTAQPAPAAQPGAEASAQTTAANDAPVASAPAQGTPANPAATPAAVQAHRAAPAPAPPAPLNTAHAVERIQAMVHVAHARGAAHARLQLHPAELGGVTIQLHVTHNGLHARIAADNAEALPLLQRAAAELQRSLEDRGIDLRGLDFGLAPDAEAGASRDDARAHQRAGAFAFAGGRDERESDGDEDLLTTPMTATQMVGLPAGSLVDVRA